MKIPAFEFFENESDSDNEDTDNYMRLPSSIFLAKETSSASIRLLETQLPIPPCAVSTSHLSFIQSNLERKTRIMTSLPPAESGTYELL
jgi:hypothetical protein